MLSDSSKEESGYVGEYRCAVCVLSLLYGVDVRNGKCLAHILWIKNESINSILVQQHLKVSVLVSSPGHIRPTAETDHIIIYRLRLYDAVSSTLGLNNK